MGKSSKPRKAYKPKYVATNPAATFFGGMSVEHADHLRVLLIKNHGAMASLMTGTGTRHDWDRLVGAVNMANVMCEQGIGNEYREITLAARNALCECGKRAITGATERFLFKGDEIAILNEFLEVHDAQCTNVRAIDLDRAASEVLRRVRYGVNTTNVRAEVEKSRV